jgi:hypothetical protein
MAIVPIKQNPNPGQVAVQLIGDTVRANKGPGIDESATVMNAVPKPFTASRPPSISSSGIGGKLDVTA